MRCRLILLLLATFLAPAARAQDSVTSADRTAVRQIISAQIDAFRHDDATTAFGFAAPPIRATFGDAPHFLAMVRQAYPLIYRQHSFSFGTSMTDEHGRLLQKLRLVGDNGNEAVALYTMEKEPDGNWRIAGCSLTGSSSQEI